jgi:hypothetical protein
MGIIYFISPVAYGMNPVLKVVVTFIFRIQHLGLGRSVVLMAAFLLPVTTVTMNQQAVPDDDQAVLGLFDKYCEL